MQIQVTEKHIKKGIKGDCELCPVAIAILENVININLVQVSGNVVFLYDKEYRPQTLLMPMEVETFVSKFDQGYEVEPFVFELKI